MSVPRQDRMIAFALPTVIDHEDIACRGEDARIFYPHGHTGPAKAKAVCGRCPHRIECLEWALETDQQHGVWGGRTPEEREQIRNNREAT